MAEVKISEELQEAFFERYFEYGDDEDIVSANIDKAVHVLRVAYGKAETISEAAENGECFDESEAVLAFQTLALAKHFFEEFCEQLPEAKRASYESKVSEILV